MVRRRRFLALFMTLAVSAFGCGGTEQGKTPSVVAQVDLSQLDSSRLIVDHGELFWNDAVRVYRVNTEGGTPSVVHENVCGPLYGFAVDADSVYMGTCADLSGSSMGLSAFGRTNGQETVLDTADYALDAAKTPSGFAYVSCGSQGGLHLLGPTGGPGQALSPGFCTYGVLTVGNDLVVFGGQAVVVDLQTKQIVPVGTLDVLGADSQRAFVARDNGSNSTEILALNPQDASLARVIDGEPAHCGTAASDGSNLYLAVIGSDADHCTILRAPVAGGSAVVLAADRPRVASIATDGDFIYWIEQSANRVMKQRL
jgi:hypothetical protein